MPDVDSATEEPEDAPRKLSTHLQDNFEAAGVAVAPDGGPVLPAASALVVLNNADWICLRGPCRHYHRLVKTFDAQKPLDGSTSYADGTPITSAEETIHTCYPEPGREMDLGDVMILDCNRWDPTDPDSQEARGLERRRAAYKERAAVTEAKDRQAAAAAMIKLLVHAVDSAPEQESFWISREAFELLMVTGHAARLAADGKKPTIPGHMVARISARDVLIYAVPNLVDDEIRPCPPVATDGGTLSPEIKEAIAVPGASVNIVHDGQAWKMAEQPLGLKPSRKVDPTRKR